MSDIANLNGKVAIVTGGGQGIGEAISRELSKRGASVVVTDLKSDTGEAVVKDLESLGSQALFISHDVSKEDDWNLVIERTVERFGKIDILVNNAGLIWFAPFAEIPVEQFDRVMAVNVRGTFLGCQKVLPAMKSAGGGTIVNMCSMSGMVSNMPDQGAYSTSKGAVRLLTKAAAIDYVQFNIRVNSIHPGVIATPFVVPYLEDPSFKPKLIGRTPMQRAGSPEEVAKVVAFLASEESSYMTGSEVVVDGGYLAC